MGEPAAKRAFHKSPVFRIALAYLALCVFATWSERHPPGAVFRQLDAHVHVLWSRLRPADGRDGWAEWARVLLCVDLLVNGYRAALVAVPVLAILGAVARTVARARVRAGKADPLARVRAFAKKHAALTFASPAIMWFAYEAAYFVDRIPNPFEIPKYLVSFAVASPPVFLLHLLLSRLALPGLLAPTLDEEAEAENAALAEDFELSAVAITREALFAVNGLAALSVAIVVGLLAMPTFDNLAVDVIVALYVPVAIGSALYFRRASRIAVGLDGIHVHGSSRSRFYAFGDLDDVRTNGIAIELLRGGRAVLRLQLHGPDAARRDALTKRLAAAVARAAEERDQPVTRFVNGATREDLSRAAEGASSYRHAAVSRDQLWAALEGPSVASDARLAAAEALARRADPSERARFRIATERCAEPSVRARMHELLEAEEDDRVPVHVGRRARLGA